MPKEKLTALAVKAARKPGRYGDGGNLYLVVRPTGSRAWVLRYALPGRKPRDMGLGSVDDVNLATARDLARAARALIFEGKDPIAAASATERAGAGRSTTFMEAADLYITAHELSWRSEVHRRQWRSTLTTYAFPFIGGKAVMDIALADIMSVLKPIWYDKAETASRLRSRVEKVLDYAAVQGWRGEGNPARWKGYLSILFPPRGKVAPVQHHPSLAWGECPALMRGLALRTGAGALALRFTILTACRTTEVLGATWREFDVPKRVWLVPGTRMKGKRDHQVPLTQSMIAILAQCHHPDCGQNDFVFPGVDEGKGLSGATMASVLKRMQVPVTVHGFRSSFRDWAADATEHPRELAEAALAHANKDKVEAAYLRTKMLARRALLMADWDAFLCGGQAEHAAAEFAKPSAALIRPSSAMP